MSTPQICIIGSGISGLALGRCLLQRGVRAVLFEKARPSQNRNRYGITLQASAYRPLLKYLDITESAFFNQVAIDATTDDRNNSPSVGTNQSDSVRVNRSRFEGFLQEGLDIRYETQFEGIGTSPDMELEFNDGTKHNSDIVVGADGVHSRLRQHISPESDFKILPYAVFNGKRRISRKEFDDKLKDHLQGRHFIQRNLDQTVFQISIDDVTREEVSISYNYSRPAKSDQDPLYRPQRAKSEATTIPDAFFEEISSHRLEEPYRTVFDTKAIRQDRILNWLMRTLLADQDSLEIAARQGVVLLGESAHAEPILGGYGANEAIVDAMILAEILVLDKPDLGQFYKKRYQDWKDGIDASHQRIEALHSSPKSSL